MTSEDDTVGQEIVDRVLSRLTSELPPDENDPADDAVVARNVDALIARGAVASKPVGRGYLDGRWPLLAAGAIAACSLTWIGLRRVEVEPAPGHMPVGTTVSVGTEITEERPGRATTEASTGLAAEGPVVAEHAIPTTDIFALPTSRGVEVHAPSSSISSSSPSSVRVRARGVAADERSAAELFTAANDARRRRAVAEATSLYLTLEARYPTSAEAITSFVALGRLELDSGRPYEALSQFDAYLRAGRKELREDAMIGRASALESLGRRGDERRAWEELLGAYPSSLFAFHARARLTTP